MKKELNNIIPFNSFWLGSCYLHAVLSALPHYEIEQQSYFGISLGYLEKDFKTSKIFESDGDGLCKKLGLGIKKFLVESAERICEKIDRGNAVIAGVDAFELPQRKDFYHTTHHLHFLLVYGYDTEKQIFNIVEHNYVNSFHFVKQEIDFISFMQACFSFNRFYGIGKYSCREIIKYENLRKTSFLSQFFSKRNCISAGSEAAEYNIKKFMDIFNAGYNEMMQNYDVLLNYFDKVVKLKHNFLYTFKPEHEKICFLSEKLICEYKFLISVIWKIGFAKCIQFSDENKSKIFAKAKTIINNEFEFHNELLNLGEMIGAK